MTSYCFPRGRLLASLQNGLIGVLVMSAVIAVGPAQVRAQSDPALKAGEIALPRDAGIDVLLLPADAANAQWKGFDVTLEGLPVVADGTRLRALGTDRELIDLAPHRIDDFAWMDGQRLLFISGDRLATPGRAGSNPGLVLPSADMKVRSAGLLGAYLFGGRDGPGRRDLYLASPDGTFLKLATLPAPIADACAAEENSDSVVTYVATGRTIFRIASGEPVELLLEADADIFSIEATDVGGIFYATGNGVGFLTPERHRYDFLRGYTGVLRANGKYLYVYSSADHRLFRIGDIASFYRLP